MPTSLKTLPTTLILSSIAIGLTTIVSRILGFARDILIATYLGASAMSDAFFVAFKIPNFLRRLFAEGAFNVAFVPIFAGLLSTDGDEKARKFADEALSLLVSILVCISILCIFGMPWLMLGLAPGFVEDADKFALTTTLTQITFPYILFISIVSLLGGILNSYQRFTAVAAAPIILNICLICIPLMIQPLVPSFAHGLAIAVALGGVMQMLWLIYWCRKIDVMPRLRYPQLSTHTKKLFCLMAPAALGAGVAQINMLIDLIIASHIESGVSYLYYADRINQLPLAVIGIAMGTALLPMLSKQLRSGDIAAAIHSQNRGIEFAMLLTLPASVALMLLAEPLIHTLYERGAFAASDTAATFPALICFAAGLPAFVLIKILVPSFYANQDTKTPVKIATVCVALNLLLNLALIGPMAHVGLALATSIAAWVNVWLLSWQLSKKELLAPDARVMRLIPRALICAAIMGAGLLVTIAWIDITTYHGLATKLPILLAMCAWGMLIYAAALVLSKTITITEAKKYLSKKSG